jgi:hypothetical protein
MRTPTWFKLYPAVMFMVIASILYLNQSAAAQPPYDPIWTKQIGDSSSDVAVDIDVDAAGNAYVAGRIAGIGALDGTGMSTPVADIVKYSPSGEILWSRGGPIGSNSELENRAIGGVAEDGLGGVYVSGTYNTQFEDCCGIGYDPDPFLRRYDSAGNLIWTRSLPGFDHDEEFVGVAADALGNVFLSGNTYGTLATPAPGGTDGFLAKYNQAGDLQWIRQFGSPGGDEFWGVAADGLGNSFVTGSYETDEVFIRKYDTNGDEVWTVITAANPDGTEIGWDIFVTDSGDLLISGQADASIDTPPGSLNFQHPFVAKLDANGNWLWLTELSFEGRAIAVAEDASGLIHAVGSRSANPFPHMVGFLTTLSPTGETLGTQNFQAGTFTAFGGIDAFGHSIYLSGVTNGALFGPNSGPPNTDAIVARFVIPEPSAIGLAIVAVCGTLVCRFGNRHRLSFQQRVHDKSLPTVSE